MPLFTGVGGFITGVVLKVGANLLGKRRTLAKPWEHLAYGAIFGYLGYNIPTWEDNLMIKVNEERVKRGYLPIERIHLIPTFGEGPISFEDKKTAPHN